MWRRLTSGFQRSLESIEKISQSNFSRGKFHAIKSVIVVGTCLQGILLKILRTIGVSCVAALMSFQAHALSIAMNLNVFTDPGLTNPAFVFGQGETAYFGADVTGTLEAGEISATIDSVAFTDITINGPGGMIAILTGGVVQAAGLARSLAINDYLGPSVLQPSAVPLDFNYLIDGALDPSDVYSVLATVDVTATINGGSPTVIQAQALTVDFQIEADAPALPAPGGILLFCIGLFAAALTRRKARI